MEITPEETSTDPTGEASAAAADGYSVKGKDDGKGKCKGKGKGKGNRKVKGITPQRFECAWCLRDMDCCSCI